MSFFTTVKLPDRTVKMESSPYSQRFYPKPVVCKLCGQHGSVNPRLVKGWDRVCAECRK